MTPKSKGEIDQLGRRLRESAEPTETDRRALDAFRLGHEPALNRVKTELLSLGLKPSTRLKSTTTIVEKLVRLNSTRLSQIQDIAGARVVGPWSLAEQDEIVGRIRQKLPVHRLDDRRRAPSNGYRAVHLIVKLEGLWIEVQVRTKLQDAWAQEFERFSDHHGRELRYETSGGPVLAEVHRMRLLGIAAGIEQLEMSGAAGLAAAQRGLLESLANPAQLLHHLEEKDGD